jgi:hypothetical protein
LFGGKSYNCSRYGIARQWQGKEKVGRNIMRNSRPENGPERHTGRKKKKEKKKGGKKEKNSTKFLKSCT